MTRQQRSLAERMAAEDDAIRQLESRLQSLELQQDVPTEEVLCACAATARPRLATGQGRLARQSSPRARTSPHSSPSSPRTGHSRRPTNKASSAATHSPTACAARPTASPTRPSRWPSSIDIETTRAALLDEARRSTSGSVHLDRDWNALVGPLAIEAQCENARRASRLAPPARRGGPAPRKGRGNSSKP